MADVKNSENTNVTEETLSGGSYEVIQRRLRKLGVTLLDKINYLNDKRKEVFGSLENTIIASDRIMTENNCVPRDMITIGNTLLFGYKVYMGLKREVNLQDVFSEYEFRDNSFHIAKPRLLADEQFVKDFKNMYNYYKDARFSVFHKVNATLLMVFQVGKTTRDLKVFKWTIEPDNSLRYVNDRSEREYQYPIQHDYEWTKTTRDMFVFGRHPHVSIEDKVFVECVGGDITIKIEDNTEDGIGIYSEPVEHREQTLDDGQIYYSVLDSMILIKILPYQEEEYRYLIFNRKNDRVTKIRDIEECAIRLPENDGIIFPKGYYLESGEYKKFDIDAEEMKFIRKINSVNGEDYLYIFYNIQQGLYILLQYNLINKRVDTPIVCQGYTIFKNGIMIIFKGDQEAKKSHTIQIWQTPFVSDMSTIKVDHTSPISKIGNKEIVKGIADLRAIYTLIQKDEIYLGLYNEIIRKVTNTVDMHYWLTEENTGAPKQILMDIHETANSAVSEYEKVVQIKKDTETALSNEEQSTTDLLNDVSLKSYRNVMEYVEALDQLRLKRGQIISLKDLRYVDESRIDSMESRVNVLNEKISKDCVDFLAGEHALTPFYDKIEKLNEELPSIEKVTECKKLGEEIDGVNHSATLLTDLISSLNIEDSTKTSTIIENISGVFAKINQIKAKFKNYIKSLQSKEAEHEFAAQVKLINQSVTNFIDQASTPQHCDDLLTKVMVQLEELEGKFSDFDEYIEILTAKRDEIYSAFNTKKVQLQEALNKKTESLWKSAERILKGVSNRLKNIKSIDELNGYFASDMMVVKVQQISEQLSEIGDTVKSEDILSKLKNLKQDGVRQIKDSLELFADGADIISLGNHKFTVNRQEFGLTTVVRDDELYYHLTGTEFFEQIRDEEIVKTKHFWSQEVVSENREIYRSEYLAYSIIHDVMSNNEPMNVHDFTFVVDSPDELLKLIRQYMAGRFDEGYEKGIHDEDCCKIIRKLFPLYMNAGTLRYHPSTRALATLFWILSEETDGKTLIRSKLHSYGAVCSMTQERVINKEYVSTLGTALKRFYERVSWNAPMEFLEQAAEFLFEELIKTEKQFEVNKYAFDIVTAFQDFLKSERELQKKFSQALKEVEKSSGSKIAIVCDWIQAFVDVENIRRKKFQKDEHEGGRYATLDSKFVLEAVSVVLRGNVRSDMVKPVSTKCVIDGLAGSHGNIQEGKIHISLSDFVPKLHTFTKDTVPAYRKYVDLKQQLVVHKRELMRLNEFSPKIMSSFVRNKLLNNVYLPLIGANMAKQMGAYGAAKRTDLMGLLLLISPPGYGKTTLMEYVANRVGLIFMKINGPALGHGVISLDPGSAGNATAREEVEKLNLALEMGNNVMIYLDDIQHCNPEFLQKFISLCDAQRKIEGVYNGKTKTYDLKGKKVLVVMAGNPYTESGEKFRIPDMLANRADTYNLGDILGDSEEDFKLSYIENCLTSNAVTNKLTARSQHDVYEIIKIAKSGIFDGAEFESNYSSEEVKELVSMFQKLLIVQEVVLSVNMQYIYSAEQDDDYRTEPSFLLQGSYRNMNKIAEKIMPVMNDKEIRQLVMDHYSDESQLLTSGAEFNLLKFKEMQGWITEEEKERLGYIRETYQKNKSLRQSGEGDPMVQVAGQVRLLNDRIKTMSDAVVTSMNDESKADKITNEVKTLNEKFAPLAEAFIHRLSIPAKKKKK